MKRIAFLSVAIMLTLSAISIVQSVRALPIYSEKGA